MAKSQHLQVSPSGAKQLWLFQTQASSPALRRTSPARAVRRKIAATSDSARKTRAEKPTPRVSRKDRRRSPQSNAHGAVAAAPTAPSAGRALVMLCENVGIAAVVAVFVFVACFAT